VQRRGCSTAVQRRCRSSCLATPHSSKTLVLPVTLERQYTPTWGEQSVWAVSAESGKGCLRQLMLHVLATCQHVQHQAAVA
jgi:hypothetical protein